jgi:hypothetical protein
MTNEHPAGLALDGSGGCMSYGSNTSECEVADADYFEGFAIEPMGFELDGPGIAMFIDSSRRL